MHVHDILASRRVIQDLGPLNDSVWSEIPRVLQREKVIDKGPIDQVGGGVAADRLERVAIELVLANEVVGGPDLYDTSTVRLDVHACVGGGPRTAGDLRFVRGSDSIGVI